MDILVVDDEQLARERLRRLLQDCEDYKIVAEAGDAERAMVAILQYDPDLVLLDIQMPGKTGLQLAEQIAVLEDPPTVVFCTAYDQHALQAFAVNASDYLMKPVRKEQLLATLKRAQLPTKPQKSRMQQSVEASSVHQERQFVSARSNRGVKLIPLADVIMFCADQKYVTVYHEGGETLIDETLKELEQEFANRLVRIHRNTLVAVDRIEAMERNSNGQYSVALKGLEQKPAVSRRHATPLKNRLQQV